MADTPKIVGPDGHIPDSQRALHTAVTEKTKVQSRKPATEGRVAELVVAGVVTGVNNMQQYFAKENARLFEEMEQICVDRVFAEIRRRSWRGRLEVRWLLVKEWARPWLMELGMMDPTSRPDHLKLEPEQPQADAAT